MSIEKIKYVDRNYRILHNHTIDEDLIKKGGWALDLGCNDFVMSNHLVSMGLNVIGIDPIKGIKKPQSLSNNENFILLEKACVGKKDSQTKTYYQYSHFGANSIYNKPEMLHSLGNGHSNNPLETSYEVSLITIKELMDQYGIDQFEYIKIDVEGAEYEILENFPSKCTKQISIEFHDFMNLTPIEDIEEYHRKLNETLSDYVKVYEEIEPIVHKPNGFQRNDTLYILKTLL